MRGRRCGAVDRWSWSLPVVVAVMVLVLPLGSRGDELDVRLARGSLDGEVKATGSSHPSSPAPPSGPAVLAALAGRCATTADEAWTVCVFRNATQRDDNGDVQLLGVWRGWDADGAVIMRFGDGALCPSGQAREARVTVQCGAATLALADAAEPSMCSYTFTLQVPIACDLLGAAAPRDECECPEQQKEAPDVPSLLLAALHAERDDPRFPKCAAVTAALAACVDPSPPQNDPPPPGGRRGSAVSGLVREIASEEASKYAKKIVAKKAES